MSGPRAAAAPMAQVNAVVVDKTRIEPGDRYPPLVGACLKTWTERDAELGARVHIVQRGAEESDEALVDRILEKKPVLVGFSCYIWNVEAARRIAAALRRRSKSVKIILGGPEVAKIPEKSLADCPAADYICLDEGEETFRVLLRHLALGAPALPEVRGLAYRTAEGIKRTPEMELIDIEQAVSGFLTGAVPVGPGSYINLELSRGCSLSCKYCDWRLGSMRYLPIERVRAELKLVVGRGATQINCADADILMNRKRGIQILETFLEAGPGPDCVLTFDSNPTFLSREAVDIMARSPHSFLPKFGLQSVDKKVLDVSSRAFDLERIEANLAYLREKAPSLKFMFSVIYALPGDSLDGFRRTLDWAYRQDPIALLVFHALILPGAAFYKEGAALGVRFQFESPHHVLETPTMSGAQIRQARELCFGTELLAMMPALRETIFAAIPDTKRRGALIEAVEGWMTSVRGEGIDLFLGFNPGEIGEDHIHSMAIRAMEKLKKDPLSVAVLQAATARYAARLGAGDEAAARS